LILLSPLATAASSSASSTSFVSTIDCSIGIVSRKSDDDGRSGADNGINGSSSGNSERTYRVLIQT
jgi:hypothetical protein